MPKYKCHKEVSALKIKEVDYEREPNHEAVLTFEEKGFDPVKVSREYARKHAPEAGGYFIIYEDGYQSFSPAEAFENGYTKL